MANVLLIFVREDLAQSEALAERCEEAGFSIFTGSPSTAEPDAFEAAIIAWSDAAAECDQFADAAERAVASGKALIANLSGEPLSEFLAGAPDYDVGDLSAEDGGATELFTELSRRISFAHVLADVRRATADLVERTNPASAEREDVQSRQAPSETVAHFEEIENVAPTASPVIPQPVAAPVAITATFEEIAPRAPAPIEKAAPIEVLAPVDAAIAMPEQTSLVASEALELEATSENSEVETADSDAAPTETLPPMAPLELTPASVASAAQEERPTALKQRTPTRTPRAPMTLAVLSQTLPAPRRERAVSPPTTRHPGARRTGAIMRDLAQAALVTAAVFIIVLQLGGAALQHLTARASAHAAPNPDLRAELTSAPLPIAAAAPVMAAPAPAEVLAAVAAPALAAAAPARIHLARLRPHRTTPGLMRASYSPRPAPHILANRAEFVLGGETAMYGEINSGPD